MMVVTGFHNRSTNCKMIIVPNSQTQMIAQGKDDLVFVHQMLIGTQPHGNYTPDEQNMFYLDSQQVIIFSYLLYDL